MRNFAKLFDIKTFMNNKEYLVIGRSNGTTKTGSSYASLKVANLNETINVSVWDMAPTASSLESQQRIWLRKSSLRALLSMNCRYRC